jgi:hypothetical protein
MVEARKSRSGIGSCPHGAQVRFVGLADIAYVFDRDQDDHNCGSDNAERKKRLKQINCQAEKKLSHRGPFRACPKNGQALFDPVVIATANP